MAIMELGGLAVITPQSQLLLPSEQGLYNIWLLRVGLKCVTHRGPFRERN